VRGISRILGLKADRAPRRVAGQREFLAIATSKQQRDRFALVPIRGGRETHGDDRLSGDDMAGRAQYVREELLGLRGEPIASASVAARSDSAFAHAMRTESSAVL
jgi:hypothetical protein